MKSNTILLIFLFGYTVYLNKVKLCVCLTQV